MRGYEEARPVANRPGYFKGYYAENKDDILNARKKRYKDDPAYRDKVLQSSREYRKNQRSEPRVDEVQP